MIYFLTDATYILKNMVFPFQLWISKSAVEHEDIAPSAVCHVALQNREGSFPRWFSFVI